MPLRKRKSRTTAPALVIFTSAINENGVKQLCCYGECTYGGTRVGPVWSHTVQAIDRLLATLTGICDCGRKFHKMKYIEGPRIIPPPFRKPKT